MGRLSLGRRVLDCFCLSSGSNSSCFCINTFESQDDHERVPLVDTETSSQLLRLTDGGNTKQTLAFQLKPKMVVLRVSMHCNGCARKVQKHISKMDGVTSYEVDLESKKVVVIGDILPFEVLESMWKVNKNSQLWSESETNQAKKLD